MLVSRIDEENLHLASATYDSGRATGIILIGQWHHHDHLNQLAARGVPLVVWGAQLPNQLYCTVGCNNIEGGRLATEHLLAHGRKRIVFLGDSELPEAAQRQEGYRQALASAGLPVLPELLAPSSFLAEGAREAVIRLKERGVAYDAIFACSDLLAMSAMGTLRDQGRQVPQDVAVIGFDDVMLAAHYHPPVTTVRQPMDAGGRALVASLLSFVNGVPPRSQILPTELIVRDSA